MNKLDEQRQKEIQQAEELLFAGPQAMGFAKGLFQGHFVSDWVMPYPRIAEAEQGQLDQTLAELRKFLNADLDPAEIDRIADIPRSVIDGLGRIGVLGMTAPKEYGGHGFSQMANCKVLEEIGKLAGTFGNAYVVIEGNTDASRKGVVPPDLVRQLSYDRADAVRKAIIDKYKFDPNKFKVVGNGWDNPVAGMTDPSNADHNKKNRRVEVKVFPLEKANEALACIRAGKLEGSAVLSVSS